PIRGDKVIAWARNFLNESAPIDGASWTDVKSFTIAEGRLVITLENGQVAGLVDGAQLAGYLGDAAAPSSILLKKNGLHLEIVINGESPIGKTDKAAIADVIVESALTTIQDCEDSVAAVDAEDKVAVYRNWLGLMNGKLAEEIEKGGKTFTRRLNPDREYVAADGSKLVLPGRSLMLVRNVGHLMTNPAILLADGSEIPEGIMDAAITALIALHDVGPNGRRANSLAG